MIPLVKDTISHAEMDALADWLRTYPRLTKGDLCIEFEENWSHFLGCKYSVFVNSGSSANLMMLYSLIEAGILKRGDQVVVPSVSWATDLAPVVQLGLEPILCDCNLYDLSIDLEDFENILHKNNPKALIFVSILGLVPNMDEVQRLCERKNVLLLEDACESFGSKYKGKNLGTFGLMSSFSTFFGHHLSTIEGGLVCTDDRDLYNLLKCIRSHGWDRDNDDYYQKDLRNKYSINDEFESLYTFYNMGFNFRSTDLQAFLGINQLEKAKFVIEKRNKNYQLYHSLIKSPFWSAPPSNEERYISNFAYPMISDKREEITNKLINASVQTRPLICGSIGRQPFWVKNFGLCPKKNADKVHDHGFYLPNNCEITEEEIKFVCSLVGDV